MSLPHGFIKPEILIESNVLIFFLAKKLRGAVALLRKLHIFFPQTFLQNAVYLPVIAKSHIRTKPKT